MNSDTKLLSSSLTPLMKFVFPFFFGFIYLIATVAIASVAFSGEGDGNTIFTILISFLFVLAVGIWALWRFCIHLKKVSLTNTHLVVSNYRQTIQIPLSEMENVGQFLWINPPLITIHLKSPSKFGKKIEFVAYTRYWNYLTNHPTYLLLKQLAEKQG